MMQSCHRQVDNAGWMSLWLAIIWWRLSLSSTSPRIVQIDNWSQVGGAKTGNRLRWSIPL